MNVYRLDYWYEERTHFEWFRSKRAAEKRCAEIRRMYSDKDLEVEKITIPSGKQGLIDWLNMYLASCPAASEKRTNRGLETLGYSSRRKKMRRNTEWFRSKYQE